MKRKPRTVKQGRIRKIIKPIHPSFPEQAEIEIHDAGGVLRQGQLGAEQRALIVKDLEIGGDAAKVASWQKRKAVASGRVKKREEEICSPARRRRCRESVLI